MRVVIADALYQSDVRDALSGWMVIDSLTAGEEAYGRLRRVAKELSIEVPGQAALVELAASGNTDAIARLFELHRVVRADEVASTALADALATVANEAPNELVTALKSLSTSDRELGLDALARGMVRDARPDAPLWMALKLAQGMLDDATAETARAVEVGLSLRIAEAKAPPPIVEAGGGSALPKVQPTTQSPGGG